MLGFTRLSHFCPARPHHWYLSILLLFQKPGKKLGCHFTPFSTFVKSHLFHSVFLSSKISKSPDASGWGSAYLSLLLWFASHLFFCSCCWHSKHLVTPNNILVLIFRFNSPSIVLLGEQSLLLFPWASLWSLYREYLLLGLYWDDVSFWDAVLKGKVLAIMENLDV